MRQNFYEGSPEDVRLAGRPLIPIHDAVPPARVEAAVKTEPFARPYGNAQRNSRLPFRAPSTPLHAQWKADLNPRFSPSFVMAAQDRIVLTSANSWSLLDNSGKVVMEERHGEGEVALDLRSGLLYFADTIGRIGAHRLSDGGKAFSISVYFGDRFRRSFIERRGQRLLVASSEYRTDPHGTREPNLSVIELQELSTPLVLSDTGRLKSARRIRALMRDTACLLTAMHENSLALATQDRLYWADAELHLQTELGAEFEPLWLSLDETPRAYLVVSGPALWVLSTTGERLTRIALPNGFEAMAPPIVGYNHTIYLVARDRILAFSQSGSTLWDQHLTAPAGGAAVTLDHQLLATVGSELIAFDPHGRQAHLFADSAGILTTPPVITPDGSVVVAGQGRAYYLRP